MTVNNIFRLNIRGFRKLLFLLMLFGTITSKAQIGDHRSELSIGINGGYVMSNVGFKPEIPQLMNGGITGGLTVRYTCEKYFNSICALVGEVNYTQMGWKEDILTIDDGPVINKYTGEPEEFKRQLTYIQIPMFARLGWGRERKGFQFFFQVGPQLGLFLNDKITSNFDYEQRNISDRIGAQRAAVQDTLAIKNKFDYGIVGGIGIEYSHPKVGHFMLEGRYYYGLGDIYGNSKQDYFGRSNNSGIMIKLSYLFDVMKTNNSKIK